jgi:hypothetical protein
VHLGWLVAWPNQSGPATRAGSPCVNWGGLHGTLGCDGRPIPAMPVVRVVGEAS